MNTEGYVWVTMTHPDVDGTAQVTREAFDGLWADKGWVEIVDSEGEVGDGIRSMSRAQLEEMAAQRGIDISSAKTKQDIAALLGQGG